MLKNEVVVTTLNINDFSIKLAKETSKAPLNIQFIIDAFKPSSNTPKTSFDIKINSLNINNGEFTFDINDQPKKEGQFDKNHIAVNSFNANLAIKSIKSDSLNIQVKRLNLKEQNGTEIKNLITRVISQGNVVQLKGFKLELPHSLLQFDRCEVDFTETLKDTKTIDNVYLKCTIVSSHITPKDASGFVPLLKNFSDRIFLKGDVEGTINDLKVNNLSLDYGDKMELRTKARIQNLNNKDSLYISGNVDKLDVTTEGIEGLLNNFTGKQNSLPKEIINMGNISFTGNISGYLKNLNAHGLLSTSLGEVKTDLIFGFNLKNGIESFFNGKIYTHEFELGRLTENPALNKLSFDLFVDLKKHKNQKMGGIVKGNIKQFDYKDYSYKDITLNAEYNGLKIIGEATVDDENVFLDIDGTFDLSKDRPELDFIAKLKHLRIDKLNLSQKYDNSFLSLNVNANFKGKTIDDIEGYLSVDSIRFYRNDESLLINEFTVQAYENENGKNIEVKSDIINGEITGIYSFSTLPASLKKTFHNYLPALIPVKELKNKTPNIENNFKLDFTIGNTEKISSIFSLPFTAYSEVKIEGQYDNSKDKFQLEIFYPSAKIAGTVIKSGYLLVENKDNSIKSDIKGIFTGKNNVQNNFTINLQASNNNIDSQISFKNDSKQKFGGTFSASTGFMRDDKNKLHTNIHINPSNITLNDTIWQIAESNILIEPSLLTVDNINIHNNYNTQYINIDGKFSNQTSNDILTINLKGIDLKYLFNTLAIDALNFGGFASGTMQAMNIDGNPYVKANISVNDFAFNNTYLGQLELNSELDDENKLIKLNGILLDDQKRKTDIHGSINPASQQLSINFNADQINIGFLNKYASSLFNNVKGLGSGSVELSGNFSRVTVMGKAFIEEGSLGINFLNTTYSFTDTIYLKKDLIYFNDVIFHDQQKNEAKISGKVVHDYFSNFMYYVELAGSNFMLYNATESLNPMFFGQVFGTGTGTINGDEQVVNINAQLKTDKKSKIRMNFMEETVNDYSFITYKNDTVEVDKDNNRPKALNALKTESGIDINMNFYVDATPDAVVEIVMDPVGGDILRSTGSGALQFIWGSNTDPKLYGTYIINNGSYNFTFQKIIERRFSIAEGSTVLFRGDPFQADINVKAIYKLNANLNDLDSDLARNSGLSSVPVECILNITGQLQHPNVGLDVALPTADAEVQRQVKSLMNNEDLVNRQMVYLLLLSKFYTPDNSRVENKSNDFASLASATLSTQLSKILSTIDERWQFGTHIRTSDGQFTSTEVELLLSSQLLNNRILINGNFGYRDDPNSQIQNALITDVDIEYLLNPAGTWRIKGYNHFNEKFYYKSDNASVQTQGIGIMYRKNFDDIREIFGLPPHYKMEIRRDSIKSVTPDSIAKGSSLGEFIKIKE